MTAPTLNDVLRSRGYTTRPGPFAGAKDVLDSAGDVLFSGRAWEVWEWLGRSGYCAETVTDSTDGGPDGDVCDDGDPCTKDGKAP